MERDCYKGGNKLSRRTQNRTTPSHDANKLNVGGGGDSEGHAWPATHACAENCAFGFDRGGDFEGHARSATDTRAKHCTVGVDNIRSAFYTADTSLGSRKT